jgi:uncharacterized protein
MSNTYGSVRQFSKMVKQLDVWLEKAVENAKARSFDPVVLLQARLAPDQYPLVRQVQSACDAAKFAAARLAGKEAPKHPDTEQTLEELRARIRSCAAYLDSLKEADLEGAEARHITLPWLEGKFLLGSDYLRELALPNFYFHVSHAYAILRHSGVPLGKTEYIGTLTTHDK